MGMNCWEFMECGRQRDGARVEEMGLCPAAEDGIFSGRNNGIHAGRSCWRAAGTFCNGEARGIWAPMMMNCATCEFFKLVEKEEGTAFLF